MFSLSPGVGLPRDWGSGCGGDFGERVVRSEEALPEAGAERAVVDGAADLEQPIGTAPRPAHLLRFVHATIDEEVGRSLGQRRANPQPGPVPFAVGLSRDWGSCRDGCWRMRIVGGLEAPAGHIAPSAHPQSLNTPAEVLGEFGDRVHVATLRYR